MISKRTDHILLHTSWVSHVVQVFNTHRTLNATYAVQTTALLHQISQWPPLPLFLLSFILLLGKQCFWHLVWWVMSLPDACSCLFGFFIGPDDSLFPLDMPHRLPQKPAGPDWSKVDDLKVRMHRSRQASTGESPLSQLTLSTWMKYLRHVHLSYCDLLMTFPSNIMKLFV